MDATFPSESKCVSSLPSEAPPSYNSSELRPFTSPGSSLAIAHALLWAGSVGLSTLIGGLCFAGIHCKVLDPTSTLLIILSICCFTNAFSLVALTVIESYDPRKTAEKKKQLTDSQSRFLWFTALLDLAVLYLVARVLWSESWSGLIQKVGEYLQSPDLPGNVPNLLIIFTIITLTSLQSLGSIIETSFDYILMMRARSNLRTAGQPVEVEERLMTASEFLKEDYSATLTSGKEMC